MQRLTRLICGAAAIALLAGCADDYGHHDRGDDHGGNQTQGDDHHQGDQDQDHGGPR